MPSFKKRLIVEQFQGNYLNSYVYAWPFKQFLYFIYARKTYATVEINP